MFKYELHEQKREHYQQTGIHAYQRATIVCNVLKATDDYYFDFHKKLIGNTQKKPAYILTNIKGLLHRGRIALFSIAMESTFSLV